MAATSATILPSAPGKNYVDGTVRLRVRFRDDDLVLTNPTTVTFTTWSPCGTETAYVYGTDAEITRPATGKYQAAIEPDEVGRWRYRWTTTGDILATEGDFLIQDSVFADPVYDYGWM
jgi:hypothetical protein